MPDTENAQPSRATLVSYIRLNLALGVTLASLASAIFGAAITTTIKIVNAQHDIDTIEERISRFDKLTEKRERQWDEQARTNASIDKRLVVLEEVARWRLK